MNNDIRHARPSLRQAAPLTFWIAIGFAVLNIGIAIALFRQPDQGGLVIETGRFTTTFWGWIFLFMSSSIFTGLLTNRWNVTRWALSMGLVVKSFFAYALIELGFKNGFDAAFAVTILWLFLAWVQFWTVVYFIPPLAPTEAKDLPK
jgi:hypothetical protein